MSMLEVSDLWEKSEKRQRSIYGESRGLLKRNKTFTNSNSRRRHGRGTKGRYTMPMVCSSSMPILVNPPDQKKPTDPMEPLYIQTSLNIFQEAFGDGKRNSLNPDQINQLTNILALPEKCFHKQTSPTTSSSGFGSTDGQICTPPAVSPKFKSENIDEKSKSIKTDKSQMWYHFWLVICIQYLLDYLKRITIKTKRRLKSKSENGDQKLDRIKKLRFDGESEIDRWSKFYKTKPFYTELHLGRESRRLTNLAAIQADRSEYPTRKLIDKISETKYITSVFEIRQRGIEEIADGVNEEIQNMYGTSEGVLIVCCEIQWSTPDRYRNINREVKMKEDLMRHLRVNNCHVLDCVSKRNEMAKRLDQFIILPDCVVEESVGRNRNTIGCFGGSYRRYYAGLLPWAHPETADEHQPWWEFKKHSMPESIDWPLIDTREKTSVIMLNLVCLKLDQL